jgi:hypothetical protein
MRYHWNLGSRPSLRGFHGAIKNPVEHREDVATGPEQRRGQFSELRDKKNQAIAFHESWLLKLPEKTELLFH